MEFMVSRTSAWGEKPCERAYRKKFIRLDVRTIGSIEEYNKKFKDNFEDRGRNHTVNDRGYIQREFDDEAWFVEIKDLKELMEFTTKHGDIVLYESHWNKNIFEIEIYDTYRE